LSNKRTLAGYSVITNPSVEALRELRRENFTGFTFFESDSVPWGVWYNGGLAGYKKTEKEAEAELIKLTKRRY